MPYYTITNKKTGQDSEVMCSYDSLQQWLSKNKDWEQGVGSFPKIVGGLSTDSGKLPEGFKDTLREMKKIHPHGKGADHLV